MAGEGSKGGFVAGDIVYSVSFHPRFEKSEVVGRKNKYYKAFSTFDIETSTINKELNIMYLWQYCHAGQFVILGRTWDEYRTLIKQLDSVYDDEAKFVIYIHNLAYEFQYLRGVHELKTEDVFLLDSRKPAKCRITGTNIELRCSYKLSNRGLANWCKSLKVAHQKLDGEEFDYSRIRTPETPLSDYEIKYGVNDVCGLWECVKTLCHNENVNMATIPLTSTGFVRRECKKVLRSSASEIRPLIPNEDTLKLLLSAMRGGDTHCNRYYAGVILEGVQCFDISSSYPFVMVSQMFPMAPFRTVGWEGPKVVRVAESKTTPMIIRARFIDVSLKNIFWGFPYLARSKCSKIRGGFYDNGRILSADSLETCVTDVDLRIILEQYNCDIEVAECQISSYGLLPRRYREHIISYYQAKTSLKNVPGRELDYEKSKNRINSIYGMTVQNPIKPEVHYVNGDFIEEVDVGHRVAEYMEKGWLPYQWGVWVTAHARCKLQEALTLLGEDAVYCDTDSVFFFGDPGRLDRLNALRIDRSCNMGAYAIDPRGMQHIMGVFEKDKYCDKFLSWGAKKYAYEQRGELTITIAGVGKIKGGEELKARGGLEVFKPGFVFQEAAGSCWYYNDTSTHWEVLEGVRVEVTPNISALPTTYEVSLSKDYGALLKDLLFSRCHSTKK